MSGTDQDPVNDLFQRWNDHRLAIRAGLDSLQSRMWTSLPCKIIAPGYDAATQTVTVQPTVKGRLLQRGANGVWNWNDVDMPAMPLVPVEFPTGGGLSLTFPHPVGLEGVVHFQSRCIDNWWAQGSANGNQPQVTQNGVGSLRQHNLSDGIFRAGARSKPTALVNVSQTAVQLRTDDGTAYIEFSATAFKVVFPGGKVFMIDANTNVTTVGNVTAGEGTGDQVDLQLHTHAHGPVPDPGS